MAESSDLTPTRGTKRKADDDLEQIQDLAFNFNGWAFNAPAGFHGEPIIVTARMPSSISYRDAMAQAKKIGWPEIPARFGLTLRERERPPPGHAQFLHVGWVPLDQESKHNKARVRKVVGTVRPDWRDISEYMINSPIMVVSKISQSPALSVVLFALVCPVDRLCTPSIVEQDEVFYLHKFRDSSTSVKDRRSNWSRMVAEASCRPGETTVVRQKKLKPATDPGYSVTFGDPVDAFHNIGVTCALFSTFVQNHEEGSLKGLLEAFQQLGKTVTHVLPRSEEIFEFNTHSEEDAGFEFDSLKFINTINDMSSDIVMTAHEAELFRASIYRQKLYMSYQHLKPLLVETIHQFRSGNAEAMTVESKVDETVKTALATVMRLYPASINAKITTTDSKSSDVSTRLGRLIRAVEQGHPTIHNGRFKNIKPGDLELDSGVASYKTLCRIIAFVDWHNPSKKEEEIDSIMRILQGMK